MPTCFNSFFLWSPGANLVRSTDVQDGRNTNPSYLRLQDSPPIARHRGKPSAKPRTIILGKCFCIYRTPLPSFSLKISLSNRQWGNATSRNLDDPVDPFPIIDIPFTTSIVSTFRLPLCIRMTNAEKNFWRGKYGNSSLLLGSENSFLESIEFVLVGLQSILCQSDSRPYNDFSSLVFYKHDLAQQNFPYPLQSDEMLKCSLVILRLLFFATYASRLRVDFPNLRVHFHAQVLSRRC